MQKLRGKDKKAAIELSIGTLVIIVLAMSMLILGLILIKNIFSGSTDAITSINKEVTTQINEVFAKPDMRMALYPTSGKIILKQGNKDGGFAFSVRNSDVKEQTFTYSVAVDTVFDIKSKCGDLTFDEANSWIVVNKGSFTLAPGRNMESPELVVFSIPETAPPCTIPFKVDVKENNAAYDYRKVYVTIQGK